MACFHPWVPKGDQSHGRPLSCGQCFGCRLERSRQWAMRCVHESKLWPDNSFVTLTYRDSRWNLEPQHFTDFMKRLRYYFPQTIRYYMAGEYGEKSLRPHYHAILFNVAFDDLRYYKTTGDGFKLYTSDTLERIWGFGFAPVGAVTFESAAYVARYVMKKLTGSRAGEFDCLDPDTGEVYPRHPEYARMSRGSGSGGRGGIGAGWYYKFKSDVYPHGKVVINGVEVNPPRYYDRLHKLSSWGDNASLKLRRGMAVCKAVPDNVPHRLNAKRTVALARLAMLKRSI